MASLPTAHDGLKSIWIFGYGSLVHTPNFDFSDKVVGYIKGYRRVFWQGSTDHRGTPQRPGRTVTLTEAPEDMPDAVTWGAAYELAGTPEEQAATLSYLEWREKQYDVRQRVDVYGADGAVAVRDALVYIASPSNANYLGPAELHDIAAQIATSRGPSGPNWEYLFRLTDAMRGMGMHDPELFQLEEMVRLELARRATEQDMQAHVFEEEEEAAVQELEHHVEFRRRHQLAQQQALLAKEQLQQRQGAGGLALEKHGAQQEQPPAYTIEAVCGLGGAGLE